MELIKLLQIEGVSEATQEDIILNFLECIDEESAFSIVEEYEQTEMSLTESIINEVSLGYALKKSLGGAVQRFKDIRKKQADISTDKPIGLAGIRKQEAQKQDVAKSQERFKQAKSTAKDIVNRMLNTRYTRDTKGATKAPDVKTETTQIVKPANTPRIQTVKATETVKAPEAKAETIKPVRTSKAQTVKTTKVVKTKSPKIKTESPKVKTTKTTKVAKVKTPEVKTEAAQTDNAKVAEVTKTDNAKVAEVAKKTITKAKEEPKQEQSKTEVNKEEKQPVAAGVKESTLSSSDREKLQKQLERLSNLPYSDKVAAKMEEIEKQLK